MTATQGTTQDQTVAGIVSASLARLGRNPEYLLQHLIEVQRHCSHVPLRQWRPWPPPWM
jgi:cation transport regulator ChaC